MAEYDPTTSYLGLLDEFVTWLRSKRWLWVIIFLGNLITAYGVAFVDYTPSFAFPYWRYVYAVIAAYGMLCSAWIIMNPPEGDE
jgi:hypothetical protein